MTERKFILELDISREAYERFYRGDARTVLAKDVQGRHVQFPAAALRRFVTHQGVQGVFVFRVDEDNKLIDVVRSAV